MTNIYEKIFLKLEAILGGNLQEVFEKYGYLKLKAPGFMDLSVDILGRHTLALAHNYEQNGDLVPDPDMEIEINFELKTAEALTMQNCFGYQQVYELGTHGEKKAFYPNRKKELNAFLSDWLDNIKLQGHTIAETEEK